MSDHEPPDLARLRAELEQATRDAKELMERLSADLHEQTIQRETHLLDPKPRTGDPPRRR